MSVIVRSRPGSPLCLALLPHFDAVIAISIHCCITSIRFLHDLCRLRPGWCRPSASCSHSVSGCPLPHRPPHPTSPPAHQWKMRGTSIVTLSHRDRLLETMIPLILSTTDYPSSDHPLPTHHRQRETLTSILSMQHSPALAHTLDYFNPKET